MTHAQQRAAAPGSPDPDHTAAGGEAEAAQLNVQSQGWPSTIVDRGHLGYCLLCGEWGERERESCERGASMETRRAESGEEKLNGESPHDESQQEL